MYTSIMALQDSLFASGLHSVLIGLCCGKSRLDTEEALVALDLLIHSKKLK